MSTDRAVEAFNSRELNQTQQQTTADIKTAAEQLWDEIDGLSVDGGSEAARLKAIALTNLETSVLFAVKAVSRAG